MKTSDQKPDSELREIFLKAVEFTDLAQRREYLDVACAGNATLRARIESLLESHAEDSFLEQPAVQMEPRPDPASARTITDGGVGDAKDTIGKQLLPRAGDAPFTTTVHYFGDYQLLEEIARGGMGVVWKARQTSLNRTVALKMILAGKFAGEADVKRFRLEAEAAANLQHPNIVAIHEVGEHEGRHYFSMDCVEGRNLTDLVRDQPLSPARAARYVKTIAEAIQYAHQRGILHRDLKPQNVLIDERDQPRVTDFGLAKLATADGGLTQTGAVMGSPSYMPPEQAAGRYDQVGPHSDVYSLGAILYELLTCKPPHVGATAVETLRHVLEREATPPSRLNQLVNPDLETICLKCLEKDPRRRYATARELAEDLARFLIHEPIRARRANPARRLWSWFIRHPWIVTGAASVTVMLTIGFGYRMWERVSALEWKLAHPKDPAPYLPGHFFPTWFVVLLFLEFFFFQLVPVVMFLIMRGRKPRGGLFSGVFAATGAAQFLFGMEVLRRAVAAQAWDSTNVVESVFASIAALTNVWFGSALTWRAIRDARLNLPGLGESDEPIEQPLGYSNRGLIVTSIGFELCAVFLSFVAPIAMSDHSWERVGGFVVGSLGMCGITGMTLLGKLIQRSKGLERQSYVPLFTLSAGLAVIGLVGVTTTTWYFVPPFYLLGIAVGLFLLKRAPIQRGYWLIAPPQRYGARDRSKANRLHYSKPWIILLILALEFLSVFWLLTLDQKPFVLHGDAEKTSILCWLAMFGSTLVILASCFVAHASGFARFGLSLVLVLPLLFITFIPLEFLFAISNPRMDWRMIALFYIGGYGIGRCLLTLSPLQRGETPIDTSREWLSMTWVKRTVTSPSTSRLALRCGIAVVLFYLVEDWRGIHAWNVAKAKLEAQGDIVEWSAYLPKKKVPDQENVFKHPFMLEYGIRAGWTGPVKPLNGWDLGFIGYGLDAGFPLPMATLKQLPRLPLERNLIATLRPTAGSSATNVDIAFTNAPLTSVVQAIANMAGINLALDSSQEPFVTRKSSHWNAGLGQWTRTNEPTLVSIKATNTTPSTALDDLFQQHHLRVEYKAATSVFQLRPTRASLAELLQRLKRNDPELLQLEEALQRPQAQLDWKATTPFTELPSPNYVLVRTAAQGLATRSKIHLIQGNPDAAFRDLVLIRSIAEISSSPPTLVGGMIKVALCGMLASVVEDQLQENLWPAALLDAVQKTVERMDLLGAWSAGIESERAAGAETIRRLANPWNYPGHALSFLRMLRMSSLPLQTSPTLPEKIFAIAMLGIPRGWFYQNMTRYIETPDLRSSWDPARQRIWVKKTGDIEPRIAANANRRSPYAILSSLAMPNFVKSLGAAAKNQTRINQAFLACALERYRADHGSYPETLEALSPQYASSLPHDLFDTQPMRYRRTDNGRYLLYSIGWNCKDNDGVSEQPKDGQSQAQWSDDKGDWVWQGVPRG